MERIFGAEQKASINFQQFYDTYNDDLKEKSKVYTDQDIFIPTPEVLARNCSLEHLNSQYDSPTVEFIPGSKKLSCLANEEKPEEPDVELKTFQILSNWRESSKSNPFTRSQVMYKMVTLPGVKKDLNLHSSNSSGKGELLVVIRVYRPTRAVHAGQTLEKPVFSEEFHCLGSNFLTELRDKISCACNGKRFFDTSSCPDAEITKNETDSGYFFIQGTFFNDQRNTKNADYSETVIDWAKNAFGLKQIKYKKADMAKTRLIDLTADLGFPQLYLHHGNCEHLFVFSQLEYIPPNATPQYPSREQFPYLCTYNIYKNYVCHMCGIRKYNFIVEKSTRQVHDPSFLCNECFYLFHYVNGEKIGEFKAYRILDAMDDETSPYENEDQMQVEDLSDDDLPLHSEIELDDINIKYESES